MQYGSKVQGRLQFTPVASLAPDEDYYTQPGEVYEFQLDTDPFDNDEEAIAQLLMLEQEFADLEVVYIKTCCDGKIVLQIRDMGPGQISLVGIITMLPYLLILAMIGVVAWTVWQVTTMPYGNLIIILGGAALAGIALYMFTAGKLPTRVAPVWTGRKPPPETKVATETAQLREIQANLRTKVENRGREWKILAERVEKLRDRKAKEKDANKKRAIQTQITQQRKLRDGKKGELDTAEAALKVAMSRG